MPEKDYADMRPTEKARLMFMAAETTSRMARTFANTNDSMYRTMMADSQNALATGLSDMATGIRATYILLAQVKRSLDQAR